MQLVRGNERHADFQKEILHKVFQLGKMVYSDQCYLIEYYNKFGYTNTKTCYHCKQGKYTSKHIVRYHAITSLDLPILTRIKLSCNRTLIFGLVFYL